MILVSREPTRAKAGKWGCGLLASYFDGVWCVVEKVTDLDFQRRNTDHAWTDVPPPATLTVS
jgi:hypothetical protein